jgi:hypothetical protein
MVDGAPEKKVGWKRSLWYNNLREIFHRAIASKLKTGRRISDEPAVRSSRRVVIGSVRAPLVILQFARHFFPSQPEQHSSAANSHRQAHHRGTAHAHARPWDGLRHGE